MSKTARAHYTGRFIAPGLRVCILRAALLLSLACSISVRAETPRFVPGQLLVKPKANLSEAEFAGRMRAHAAWHRQTLRHINVRVINVDPERAEAVLAALRSDPGIEYAEHDGLAQAAFIPNDPYVVSGAEWHLAKTQAPLAWNFTTGRANVVVAILDSGINAAHPDLAGRILPGYDFVSNDGAPADDFGHGTAVAGVVVADGDNGIGVAGVAYGCSVLPVKVMDANGLATYSCLAQGIKYAVDQGARVINMSLAGPSASSTLQDAIDYAWSSNVVVVAAAGNGGTSTPLYPAACNHVIAVAATEPDDSLAAFSSYGATLTLSAPGDNIWTTQRDLSDPYGAWRGTSFASPVVAGVAALAISANPSLSNTNVVSLLKQTADDLGTAGFDAVFGYGRVNALRAVNAANPDLVATNSVSAEPPASSPNVPPDLAPVASSAHGSISGLKGRYAGLAANTNGVTPASSAYFRLSITPMGRFTGKLVSGGRGSGFHGQFNPNGDATVCVRRGRFTPLTLTLHLNGTDQVTGLLTDGAWAAEVLGDRNVFNARWNPAQQAGVRSFVLEPADNLSETAATGSSRISAGGAAHVRGKLRDGRPFATASSLARNGDCPFYLSLNRGNEVVIGWLNFPAGPAPLADGTVLWVSTGTNAFAARLTATSGP